MLSASAERLAINSPLQGTAADIIKKAMIALNEKLRGAETRMLMQVHDELVFEAPKKDVEEISRLVKKEMEGAVKLRVPLRVETGWAADWGSAH